MAQTALSTAAAAAITEHLHDQPLIRTGPADRHQSPLRPDVQRNAEHLAGELLLQRRYWRGEEFTTEKGRLVKDSQKIAHATARYTEPFSFACCFLDAAVMVHLAVPPDSLPDFQLRLDTMMYNWRQGTRESSKRTTVALWRSQQFLLEISFLPQTLLPENDDSDGDPAATPPLPHSYARLRVRGTILPPAWRCMSAVCKNWDAAVSASRSACKQNSACEKARPRDQHSLCDFLLTPKRRRLANPRRPRCLHCRPMATAKTGDTTDTDTDSDE